MHIIDDVRFGPGLGRGLEPIQLRQRGLGCERIELLSRLVRTMCQLVDGIFEMHCVHILQLMGCKRFLLRHILA